MNNPPSWTSREESLLLLNAYIDNELDAASVLDVERRMGSDAALKAELSPPRGASQRAIHARWARSALRMRCVGASRHIAGPSRARRRIDAARADLGAELRLAADGGCGSRRRVPRKCRHLHWARADGVERRDRGDRCRATSGRFWRRRLSTSLQVTATRSSRGSTASSLCRLRSSTSRMRGSRSSAVAWTSSTDTPCRPVVYKRREHVISLTAVPKPGSKDDGRTAYPRDP